jgi:hypothetical protein
MSETLLRFQTTIKGPDGTRYEARACGSEMPGGHWQGWVEFVPIGGGPPVRSGRETTQPNRKDTEYWATGLTPVYLEGALQRSLTTPARLASAPVEPSIFRGPAPAAASSGNGHDSTMHHDSVMDPFAVYEKGESLLRKQLGALSAWHLVNIALDFKLTDVSADQLNRMPGPELIELIVAGVRVTE